jgi:hypothetical protein
MMAQARKAAQVHAATHVDHRKRADSPSCNVDKLLHAS